MPVQPYEAPLDPDRPIIDPHLHLWDIRGDRRSPQFPHQFLLQDALQTIEESGHNITHSVYVEAHAMYRAEGPQAMKPVGETEFANGCAAMGASGNYGPRRLAHRIVGNADLTLGAAVTPVLEAHLAAAGERFRGIRCTTAFSEAGLFGYSCPTQLRTILREPSFIEGAGALVPLGLSLDVWCLHPQLGDLVALADAQPELTIILDHLGTLDTGGAYAGRWQEAFGEWRESIAELARRPNTRIKLGGLGMDPLRPMGSVVDTIDSEELARRWRPCIETAIEHFTPARCMFESNFPPDRTTTSYGATWNAFKRIADGCSEAEKDSLFRATAAQTYGIMTE